MEKSNKKAAGLLTHAAYQIQHPHNKTIRTRIKAFIICLACWGLMPVKLTDWIIQRGGLRDA